MAKLKNLATCKPSEFLKQTNRIRKAAAEWLTATDVLSIRKNVPKLDEVTDDMSDAEKAEVNAKNRKMLETQAKANVMAILDAVMEEHPDETLALLALMCFVEPKDVDKHPVGEYLGAFTDLLNDENVIGFFISLARLGQTPMRMR